MSQGLSERLKGNVKDVKDAEEEEVSKSRQCGQQREVSTLEQ